MTTELDPKPWTTIPNSAEGRGYRTDERPFFSELAFYFEPRDGYSQDAADYS